jgi:pilus assembly protein Flp/PilA
MIEMKAQNRSVSDVLLFSENTTMSGAVRLVSRFLVSEDGPTAVEYAVMIGLLAVTLIAMVGKLSESCAGTMSTVSSTLGS